MSGLLGFILGPTETQSTGATAAALGPHKGSDGFLALLDAVIFNLPPEQEMGAGSPGGTLSYGGEAQTAPDARLDAMVFLRGQSVEGWSAHVTPEEEADTRGPVLQLRESVSVEEASEGGWPPPSGVVEGMAPPPVVAREDGHPPLVAPARAAPANASPAPPPVQASNRRGGDGLAKGDNDATTRNEPVELTTRRNLETRDVLDPLPQARPKAGITAERNDRAPAPAASLQIIATSVATIQEVAGDSASSPRLAMPPQFASHPAEALPSPAARAAVPAVAAEIATQLRNGHRHFEIRLEPAELGRIEVKLDFRPDGSLTAKLVVDRPDTLEMLVRDARGLERTLQSNGLRLEDGAVNYELRDRPANERHDQPEGGRSFVRGPVEEPEAGENSPDIGVQHWRTVSLGKIDIRI